MYFAFSDAGIGASRAPDLPIAAEAAAITEMAGTECWCAALLDPMAADR